MILSCELNALHVQIVRLWLYLAQFVLGTMFFSFGVKDPFVIMNVSPTCYLVEKPKLPFAAKELHVPCLICKS
jgi:hypothetical protein